VWEEDAPGLQRKDDLHNRGKGGGNTRENQAWNKSSFSSHLGKLLEQKREIGRNSLNISDSKKRVFLKTSNPESFRA